MWYWQPDVVAQVPHRQRLAHLVPRVPLSIGAHMVVQPYSSGNIVKTLRPGQVQAIATGAVHCWQLVHLNVLWA